MAPQKVRENLSIVVVGAFNPSIFQPAWLVHEGLMREGDGSSATVELIHPEVTVFSTEWFRCSVTRDRFSIETARESHHEPLRDLVAGLFSILRHTPTRACGINHIEILRLANRQAFDRLGWKIAPRENWEGVLERPGMARLDELGVRTDGHDGHVRVKIEPILDDSFEIVAEVNDHFAFSSEDSQASTGRLSVLLSESWPDILSRARMILDRVKDLAK